MASRQAVEKGGKLVRTRRWYALAIATVALVSLSLVGLASAKPEQAKTKVTVQLKWVTQAQFAGYYAAKERGFYDRVGLDVTIKPGGPDIIPEQVVLGKQAEFGLDWLPSLLATRDKGGDIVNIAQIYSRSGTTEIAWRDSGIRNFCDFRGKRFGVWLGGNEFEQYAALAKCGINPQDKKQITIVAQSFSMDEFLARQIDGASAMTYNELAQVLETRNPKTGKLYTLRDLRVFTMQGQGTGMLQDGIFVRADWIKDPRNQEIATKFLEATFQGWIYCRDNWQACVNIVLKNGPTLGRGHQRWQMNEVNKLIWPTRSPLGIGMMVPADFRRTAEISRKYGIIKKAPSNAYTTKFAKAALENLKKRGLDVRGLGWKPATVRVTEGGK
jgi:NitT/TauT family transport system substrate-binding protein